MGSLARRLEARQVAEGLRAPADLEQWAADELSHAIAHDWMELRGLLPWADVIDADHDGGRPYEVVRNYRWAEHEGGDMVCEVTVYATPDRRGHFVRRRCVIRKH